MQLCARRLSRSIALAMPLLVGAPFTLAAPAPVAAGPAPGLCAGDATRGTVPADFALDACVNGTGVWVRNNLTIPVHLATSGSAGTPAPISLNQTVAAVVTRIKHPEPLQLMPSDLVYIPAGAGNMTVTIASTDAGGLYALALTASTFIPAGAAVQVYQAGAEFVTEIADVYGQYRDCLVGKNWIGQLGCDALLTRNVTFAIGRGVANGLAKGLLNVFLTTGAFLKWADTQVPDVASIIHGSRTISLSPALPPATPPPATPPPAKPPPATPPPAPGTLTVTFAQNPFLCDGSSHGLGTLAGAQAGERVTFSSPQVGGLLPGTANGSGQIPLIWQCNPSEAGQSWTVTAVGQASGRSVTFTVVGVAPAPPPPTPPPPTQPPAATWDEIAWGRPGGTVPLFSGGPGVNANGASGPAARLSVGSHVTVDCRSHNQAVAPSNTGGWWYHISARRRSCARLLIG
jgi:hypothetical protein